MALDHLNVKADYLKVKARRATFGAQVQAARGLLGWTRARLSSECGLSERSLWNIEKGLTARPYAKTQTAICTAFEVAGIGFTINDPPILRSKKGAGWIGPAITTKFAVGDDVHFHPIAWRPNCGSIRIIRGEGTNARKRRREQLPH